MRIQVCLLMVLTCASAVAQTFTEKIAKELAFERVSAANALIIANINGSVKVSAYEGTTIQVEAVRTINAKTDERLETGKQEVQLAVIDRADTLIVYVSDGCHEFRRNRRQSRSGGWSYESSGQHNCHTPYDFRMDFRVSVPRGVNLLVSTINDGDIEVADVTGVIKASNINGGIRLSNLRNQADARTINGDVVIDYASNPTIECRFYTLNGDIDAQFQPGLSADLSFESFNGDFYTNLERLETLPANIQRSERGDGLRYKISGNQYKVGNGGPLLDFETFNGNVYLKEK